MSKSLKTRIWLQYILDILICLNHKIFLSYHVFTIYFRIFGFESLCIAQVLNLPLNLCDAHLKKSKNSEITCSYL